MIQRETYSEPGSVSDAVKLLVVDDEAEISSLLRDVLTAEGYAVETCNDGREALKRLSSIDFDGVITDLKMPGVDGLEVARAAKARCPETATVVVTAYASLDTAIGALRTGVDDYIRKPFNIDQIVEVVHHALSVRTAEKKKSRLLDQLRQSNSRLVEHERKLADQVISASRNLVASQTRLTRRVSELAMLNDISAMLTNELNLDRLLNLALRLVGERMGVRASMVLLEESSTGRLIVRACHGCETAAIGEFTTLGEGISGRIADTRAPLLVEDLGAASSPKPARCEILHLKSVLGVPLTVKDSVIGVLLVYDKVNRDRFTPDDTHILVTIASQLGIAIENARLYEVLQDSTFQTVQALATSLEAKDNYTSGHSERVTNYSLMLATVVGLDEKQMQNLRYASQLHDIGKIGITERILNKPDRLTDWEFQAIKDHPVIGERIVRSLDFLDQVRVVIRHHHERWDGTGYPDNLAGENIPLLARIMAIADSYDAMTTARPYRGALSPEVAASELIRGKGTQFDPRLVGLFLDALREHSILTEAISDGE